MNSSVTFVVQHKIACVAQQINVISPNWTAIRAHADNGERCMIQKLSPKRSLEKF